MESLLDTDYMFSGQGIESPGEEGRQAELMVILRVNRNLHRRVYTGMVWNRSLMHVMRGWLVLMDSRMLNVSWCVSKVARSNGKYVRLSFVVFSESELNEHVFPVMSVQFRRVMRRRGKIGMRCGVIAHIGRIVGSLLGYNVFLLN